MRILLEILVAAQPALAASFERLPEGRLPSAARPTSPVPKIELPEIGANTVPVLPNIPSLDAAADAVLPGQVSTGLAGPQAVLPGAGAETPQAALASRLEPIAETVAGDIENSGRVSGEIGAQSSEGEIRLLQGGAPEAVPSVAAALPEEAPHTSGLQSSKSAPLSPERQRDVKLMMWGTPAYKVGAEVVTLSFPLLVMKSLGGATMVAGLLIVYQLAQAVGGALTPPLLRRFPASKVLAASVLAQGVLVGGLLALAAAHAVTASLVFPVYGLIGAAIGVADTCRRLMPSLLLGHDEEALRVYNARMHRRYETAGVIGSALGGAMIALVGPLYAMLIQPPAYLISAFLLWKVRKPVSAQTVDEDSASWGDVFKGAKKVLTDRRFRWLAAAMVLPQIIHRVFENLLLPVYAKTLLGAGALAAVLLTASNFGELGGASLILKRSQRYPGPSAWVRWGAFGLLAGWMLPLAGLHLPIALALGLLVPAIFVFSSTWAASQLSLDSDVQRAVSQKEQPGVMSFLNGLFIAGTALVSLGLGWLLDYAGTGPALLWICAGFTAVGLLVYRASVRLKNPS
ncbi:MAG: hypothetical protein HY077_04805 [Elusimicrobia bacterium]|nr:hypothetical protein [Elusimicrobiota bacterium]